MKLVKLTEKGLDIETLVNIVHTVVWHDDQEDDVDQIQKYGFTQGEAERLSDLAMKAIDAASYDASVPPFIRKTQDECEVYDAVYKHSFRYQKRGNRLRNARKKKWRRV